MGIIEADVGDLMELAQKSRSDAKKYEWLYHCTTKDAFISMIRTHEMWLSNLKIVNDKEEANRIDLKRFQNKFYIGSFTYDFRISDEHWDEYGTSENGILIGFKPEWFKIEPVFMLGDNTKDTHHPIYPEITLAPQNSIASVWSVRDSGFYKVVYDDDLMMKLQTEGWIDNCPEDVVKVIVPNVAGIIKKTHGLCERAGKKTYIKNWKDEKEVRLKIYVDRVCGDPAMDSGFFPKMEIPLNEKVFEEVRLKFSPKFSGKEDFAQKVKELLPNSTIEIL